MADEQPRKLHTSWLSCVRSESRIQLHPYRQSLHGDGACWCSKQPQCFSKLPFPAKPVQAGILASHALQALWCPAEHALANRATYLFACNQCVLYAVVHSPLILFADISIAFKALYLASKARGEVFALKVLYLRNATLPL